MTPIHFYHLTTTPLARALPKLLEKAYAGNFRILVVAEEKEVEPLNELLWTYDPNSFLPHGSAKDGTLDKQPIFICSTTFIAGFSMEAHQPPPFDGVILCITNGMQIAPSEGYDRILDIFDGSSESALSSARERWKHYKNQGISLVYHQQTDAGSWTQKAVA